MHDIQFGCRVLYKLTRTLDLIFGEQVLRVNPNQWKLSYKMIIKEPATCWSGFVERHSGFQSCNVGRKNLLRELRLETLRSILHVY